MWVAMGYWTIDHRDRLLTSKLVVCLLPRPVVICSQIIPFLQMIAPLLLISLVSKEWVWGGGAASNFSNPPLVCMACFASCLRAKIEEMWSGWLTKQAHESLETKLHRYVALSLGSHEPGIRIHCSHMHKKILWNMDLETSSVLEIPPLI